ncbi:hypothetical protein [Luteipulveratus mongoliensis]|uniref:Uncharacterized protein n=1 Tax=Luteipulveratus mongoliensis TaxID=571913 RepID=A0A0K1JE88_9MICO|nr:hypothetical protein [Luteipulveratus mongoliensis]AKU15021.1 hypothetical protein VV02_02695 [Luteipulveratus mongoliensis]
MRRDSNSTTSRRQCLSSCQHATGWVDTSDRALEKAVQQYGSRPNTLVTVAVVDDGEDAKVFSHARDRADDPRLKAYLANLARLSRGTGPSDGHARRDARAGLRDACRRAGVDVPRS